MNSRYFKWLFILKILLKENICKFTWIPLYSKHCIIIHMKSRLWNWKNSKRLSLWSVHDYFSTQKKISCKISIWTSFELTQKNDVYFIWFIVTCWVNIITLHVESTVQDVETKSIPVNLCVVSYKGFLIRRLICNNMISYSGNKIFLCVNVMSAFVKQVPKGNS